MQKFINFLSPLPTMWKNYDTKVFDGPNLALSDLVSRICVSFMVVKIWLKMYQWIWLEIPIVSGFNMGILASPRLSDRTRSTYILFRPGKSKWNHFSNIALFRSNPSIPPVWRRRFRSRITSLDPSVADRRLLYDLLKYQDIIIPSLWQLSPEFSILRLFPQLACRPLLIDFTKVP